MSIAGQQSLRLQVLGPLRLWRGGAEVDAGPRQQAYLLALLLARAGRPTSTTELIDLIWGDDAPASALNVIHKYVGSLRRVLEPQLPVRGTGAFVHRRTNAYLFTAGPGTLDLVAFRELVARAKAAAGHAALDLYAEALGLWRGPAGGGIATAAAAPVFAALDDEFHDACAAAAGVAAALGQPERVLPAVQLAASMAPFHEPVQASLVRVLGAAGRQAEALAVFCAVRDRLADELGVDPGPALVDAHRQVLTSSSFPSAGPAPVPVAAPASSAAAPTAAPAGLVGRTAELAVLRWTVERALAGRTAIAFVEGEPGAGKTRLLEETAAFAARHGALVVWGSGLQGDGVPSMWPWEQALGPVVDGLPAPAREKWLAGELGGLLEQRGEAAGTRSVPDGNAQFRLFEQVVAVIGQASAQRPTLLVFDDLHWADAASLQLLGHLATRLPDRTAIVGALRDRAPLPSSDLSRVLAAAGRSPDHRRFRLGPLGLADVAELIRHETGTDPEDGVARSIYARTAGNPFFVRELSRLLDGDSPPGAGVPSTVRDVVRRHVAGLDRDTSELLDVAALIGRDVDLRLLSRAAGVEPADCFERLEPLHALGLLETSPDDPSAVRFAHDLVRESISETTTQQRALRLHLRVADALDHIHAGDEAVAERLAFHLWAAGPLADPGRTAEALARAGRRAASKPAYLAADRQLRQSAQPARAAGVMDLELSAVVRRHSGYDSSTFDLLDRAEYLARTLGRDAEAA
ncbi:AAA family ATPase [Dactylosporangium sp. NPDC049742]|uniref:BTAD domain-containing putative transcriptional regulator n=1 Tax=Dactylosporangium sp. NPDC049742 TaxID=3154737 RepID=UPI00341DF8FF